MCAHARTHAHTDTQIRVNQGNLQAEATQNWWTRQTQPQKRN